MLPVIVLLHGAWHSPACWDPIVPLLEQRGHRVLRPALPSAGAAPPVADMEPDIAAIRTAVQSITDAGGQVVVVMHSFSGMPGGCALENLGRAAYAARGLPGGVVRLIYIMAFLVPEGFQHSPTGTREGMVPAMITDIPAGIVTVDPSGAKDMMYQDCTEEQVAAAVASLRPHSLGPFWSKTRAAAWRVIPTTYVICERDSPSTVAAVQWLIHSAKESGPHRIDHIVRCNAGHSPFISQPEWTAEMLHQQATTTSSSAA